MRGEHIRRFIGALCAAIAMVIQYSVPYYLSNTSYEFGLYEEIFYNFRYSLQNEFFVLSLIFVSFYLLSGYVLKKQISEIGGCIWIEVLVAFIWLLGKAYAVDNTLGSIMISNGQIVKNIVVFIGYFFIIHYLFKAFVVCLYSRIDIKKSKLVDKISKMNSEYPFRVPCIILSIFAFFHAIVCFPGIMCNDTWTQVQQYIGGIEFTTHHPVAHTLLVGWCLEIGNWLGSVNVGLFLYVVLQEVLFVLIFSYVLYLMNKWEVKRWIKMLTYIVIICSPYFLLYSGIVIKDSIYGYFALLFVIELMQMVLTKNYFSQKKHIVLYMVSVIGTILMRNNGTYIVIPTIFVIFVLCVKQVSCKKRLLRCVIYLILPLLIAIGINKICINVYDIEDHSIVDALSLPVQQTARYVSKYADEITEEEAEVLNRVFDYEKLKTAYNPKISDPVKNIFRREATSSDLKEYFIVWMKMFLKHPMVYFEATINQNYTMVSPMVDYVYMYNSTFLSKDVTSVEILDGSLYEPDELDRLKNLREYIGIVLFVLPVTGILSNYAVYNLIFIALLIIVVKTKKYKILIPMLPLIISDLVVLAAPVVDARYAFPIIYAIPIMIALVTKEIRSKEHEEDSGINTML